MGMLIVVSSVISNTSEIKTVHLSGFRGMNLEKTGEGVWTSFCLFSFD
jgi:hypothetical protein